MNLTDKLNPNQTALIVIDIQNDFASPSGLLAKNGRDLSMVPLMIKRLQSTIKIAEHAGIPVLYAQQIYDRSKLIDLQKEQYDLDSKYITCDIKTEGYKFYKINPEPKFIFKKYNYNIFSNPELEFVLKARGIKTLVITGMDTYWCVETAIRNAFDLGYKVVVPEDLVAGNFKHLDLHTRTLELTRLTFGVVTNSKEINKIWKEYKSN